MINVRAHLEWQRNAEWIEAKEMSGTMMTTWIAQIEPHTQEKCIFLHKIYLYGKLVDAFSVELWLCARVSRQQTHEEDMSDIGRGKPLNAALNTSVHKISSIETFPFRISINGQFSIRKWTKTKKKCAKFIFMFAVEPSHYCAVHKNAWFSLCGRMMKSFTNPSKCLHSGQICMWNGNYYEWIEFKVIFNASRALQFSIRQHIGFDVRSYMYKLVSGASRGHQLYVVPVPCGNLRQTVDETELLVGMLHWDFHSFLLVHALLPFKFVAGRLISTKEIMLASPCLLQPFRRVELKKNDD